MFTIIIKIIFLLLSMLCAYLSGQGSMGKDSFDEGMYYIGIILSLVIGLLAVFLGMKL